MLRKTMVALATCAVAVIPASASAAPQHLSTCEKAYNVRQVVIKKHGKRAPGRNICRFGIRLSNGATTKAKHNQRKRYLFALRSMAYASPYLVAGSPKVPPAGTATPRAGGVLDRIAACESGGNYQAVDPTGTYTGRYQFDDQTWQSMGGSGRAGDAPPGEQDQRAAALLAQRGTAPWPVCGR